MGFMTDITIQNDFLSELKKDPAGFVDAISFLMSTPPERRRDYRALADMDIKWNHHHIHGMHHADDYRVIYSGENMSLILNKWITKQDLDERSSLDEKKRIAKVYLERVKRAQRDITSLRKYLKEVIDE